MIKFRNECESNETLCWDCYGDESPNTVDYYKTIRWILNTKSSKVKTVLSIRNIVDWVSLIVGVVGFVGNFASIYILSLPSIGR